MRRTRWVAPSRVWMMAGAVCALLGVVTPAAGAFPPDGRGYERVSPLDKNGGDVDGDGQGTVASVDGNAVAYASRAGFADTRGSGVNGQTQYVARRTSEGWVTHAITPTPNPASLQIFLSSTVVDWFSNDLSSAVVSAYDLPAVSDDVADGDNIYRENLSTDALDTVTKTAADPISPFDFPSGQLWGSSRDGSHIALVSSVRLLPEAPTGVPNVYDWSGGSLKLAGVLPDGSIPPEGSDMQPQRYRDTVSADGSRLAFISPPSGTPQLYLRIDGSRTVWVSQSEGSVAVPTPTDVNLQAMTPDGRHVLFTTDSQLLDADTNSGPDVYMYTDSPNPSTDSNLTLISNNGDVDNDANGTPVVGLSDDGSTIYFESSAANTLYVWHDGVLRTISRDLRRFSPSLPGGDSNANGISITSAEPGLARVSRDGNVLAFISDNTLNGQDGVHSLTGQVTNGLAEMYVYDARADHLSCVSCPSNGPGASGASVTPAASTATPQLGLRGTRPSFLTSDGSRVFFSTADALVPEDVNGVSDVYEYDVASGKLSLISTGKGADGTWFADASASGNDLFLLTRQRLVASDRDSLVDLYDARVGGGFPEPPPSPTPCVADACQGALGAAPGLASIGSVTFNGASLSSTGSAVVRLGVAHAGVVSGSAGTLAVRVPGSGRLSWSGSGLRRGSRATRKATYKIKLVLTASARRALAKRHVYRTRLKLVFAPAGHPASSVTISLTFKSKSSKKGRGR